MEVSFWKRSRSEAPTNFDELCFSEAVPEQPVPTAASSVRTSNILSFILVLCYTTQGAACCAVCELVFVQGTLKLAIEKMGGKRGCFLKWHHCQKKYMSSCLCISGSTISWHICV